MGEELCIGVMKVTMRGVEKSKEESKHSHYPSDDGCSNGIAADLLGGISELFLDFGESIVSIESEVPDGALHSRNRGHCVVTTSSTNRGRLVR